ncbi:MLO-like protein 13 isoform X3 [Benincasa hispida]|uniref:MLO-like protein 13 isoform X3 n=1 Tax=Benincasa hispida TaxID=102211 RepID=UPI0018FF2CE6|nr:MLO-like protein 13 isoform X3 [Benincasa hispida]
MDARGNIVHETPPNAKFEFTPTWIIAVVSSIIVIISFSVERGLHRLGQLLKHKKQDELNHALLKLKEGKGSSIVFGSIASAAYFHICVGCCSCLLLCYNHASSFCKDDEFKERAEGFWKNAAVIAWMVAFAKQFHGSITKSDYIYLRRGFIKKHCPGEPKFNFYEHITKTYQHDFKKVVGISWYLWAFVVLFLLLNLEGWHTYFWLSFLPLIMLLLVGAKLEYIITRMAQELNSRIEDKEAQQDQAIHNNNRFHRQQRKEIKKHGSRHAVNPSDEHFWFGSPSLVLVLIHFILFQNSFEIAFFFWIWTTYGFKSCIMEKPAFIITRLILGAIVQVLCSYSTLPLYSLVTQMGSEYKKPMEEDEMLEGQDHKVQERSS